MLSPIGQGTLSHRPPVLTKTDGTVIDLSNAGGSIGPEDGKTVCSKGEVFDEILPLEELASVSVGGVEFPIPAE